ncbi:MAG: hypothetical protein ACREJO_14005 [Phycisphaerales bacterium]
MHAHLARLIILSLLVLLPLAGCDKYAAEKTAIRDTYDRYRAASDSRDGSTAASLVSESSFEHNDRTTGYALSMPTEKLKALSAAERFDTLHTRHMTAGDKSVIRSLQTLKGAPLWAFMVTQGWNSADKYEVKLGKIRVNGSSAEMEIYYDGEKDDVPVYFVKDGGKWLLDFSQDQRFNRTFASYSRKHKISENELFMLMLEEMSGREPDRKIIWKPLGSGSGSSGGGNPLLDN